jgi:hypothetical protein
MARFKKRSSSRRSGGFRGFARRAARKGGVGRSANLIQLDAMIYGAARAPVSGWLASVLPLPVIGTIGDEVVMGAVNYLVSKNTSGMVRDVALKGLVVENARLGEALIGMTGIGSGSSGSGNLLG